MLTKYEPIAKYWSAYMLYDQLKRDGVIFVFRQVLSENNSNIIYLKALKNNAMYTLENIDTGLRIVRSGNDLMTFGILVDLPDKPDSAIFKIRAN